VPRYVVGAQSRCALSGVALFDAALFEIPLFDTPLFDGVFFDAGLFDAALFEAAFSGVALRVAVILKGAASLRPYRRHLRPYRKNALRFVAGSAAGQNGNAAMSAPLLLDLSHTSHTRARTGIQRVSRSLRAALADRAIAITHDPHRERWRPLEPWELENFSAPDVAVKRGATWPLAARLRGRAHRWLKAKPGSLPANSGLLVPEVFSPAVARALPELFAATRGPRVAIFHDAIALRFPELTPTKTVARFPAYLRELLKFDGIAAVSEDSRTSLLEYWEWLGAEKRPPVKAIPLGVDPQPRASSGDNSPNGSDPVVLSIGTIEGRKNHLALLDACEALWSRGQKFALRMIGSAQTQTGAAALALIRKLQDTGRPLRYDGAVSDAEINAAYAACTFTVYPSLSEGFGLPVIESLAHGKPCICSAQGALGESARGGGCATLAAVDATALTAAMDSFLRSPTTVAQLAAEARERRFKSWDDYANDVVAWIDELRKSSP
jgi:glycosyltransferase involved in cell wall biosynthesis